MYNFLFIMGIITYILVIFSFLTGMKIIKVKFRLHKKIGIAGFCCASVHGILMLVYNLI